MFSALPAAAARTRTGRGASRRAGRRAASRRAPRPRMQDLAAATALNRDSYDRIAAQWERQVSGGDPTAGAATGARKITVD